MVRHALAAALVAALAAVPPSGAAQVPAYDDPWSARTQTAAEAAVARLGAKRALEIQRAVVRIAGLEAGATGRGTSILASVQGVQRAMRELGARETELEVRVDLPADVLFDFDQAEIRPDAARALAQLATLIRGYPNRPVSVEGHTDARGNDTYNQGLSERRAESVKRWLTEREGIAADRLATGGRGESRPVAGNGTEEGRQRNRRVEVIIHKGS
jgi:outer membrane protein OmpA-like peptidoglycan-associated protein